VKGGIRVLDGDGGLWWRRWRKEVGWERGLSIVEERPSGVWRRLRGGEEREITVSQQQQGALNEIDVTFQ